MPLNHLSKFLYPSENDWHRRKQFKTLVKVVFVTLVVACLVWGLVLFFAYKKPF